MRKVAIHFFLKKNCIYKPIDSLCATLNVTTDTALGSVRHLFSIATYRKFVAIEFQRYL